MSNKNDGWNSSECLADKLCVRELNNIQTKN